MSIRIINVGNHDKAILEIKRIKNKNYGNVDIRVNNVHLRKLNKLTNIEIFVKNDLYVSAETLWTIMQSEDIDSKHHGHNLTAEDVVSGLRSICEPNLIVKAENNRYLIVTLFISSVGAPLMMVMEVNAGLVGNQTANINKIVTIYPRGDISDLLKDKDLILFQK